MESKVGIEDDKFNKNLIKEGERKWKIILIVWLKKGEVE